MSWGPRPTLGAGAPPSPCPAPSAAAHGCHFPQVGTQGRWVMAVWASMTPGVPLEVPRGGKTSLTGTRAKHGERQGALSVRELPEVQASGGGRGSASPYVHVAHSGRQDWPLPALSSPTGLSVLTRFSSSPHREGTGWSLSQWCFSLPLPWPWATWAPFGALCQTSAHTT